MQYEKKDFYVQKEKNTLCKMETLYYLDLMYKIKGGNL